MKQKTKLIILLTLIILATATYIYLNIPEETITIIKLPPITIP